MKIAQADGQLNLLNVMPNLTATNNASARNAYGTAAQEIVCATLQLNPIRISGNFDICFDAKKEGYFYEIKSVRRGAKVVIYKWRMEKEGKVPNLFYAILVHQSKGLRNDVLGSMLKTELTILVLPAYLVHASALCYPLRNIRHHTTSRSGYNRKGYRDGYFNVPIKHLTSLTENQEEIRASIYGQAVSIHLLS